MFYVATNQLWNINLFALFPGLLQFYLPFACTVSERRPGLIYHELMQGGCREWVADIQICTYTAWKRGSFLSSRIVSTTLLFEVQNCGRALEHIHLMNEFTLGFPALPLQCTY